VVRQSRHGRRVTEIRAPSLLISFRAAPLAWGREGSPEISTANTAYFVFTR
jgi:hypothetical protein